jgi:hypothetical protein
MLTTALPCPDPAIEEECMKVAVPWETRPMLTGSDPAAGPSLGCSDAIGPSKLDQALTVLNCIREVRGSKFGWDTILADDFRGFSQSAQANAEIVPQIMAGLFLSIIMSEGESVSWSQMQAKQL